MGYKLSVFTLDLVQSDSLVFFTLTDLSKISSECLKAITLLPLQLLSQLLVELILLLKQLELLSHLLVLKMVSAATLFDLGEQLGRLCELCLQECICLQELIALSHCKIKLTADLIERCDLSLSLAHLVSALLAELVVMGSQQCDLLKQDMVLFSQQMDPLLAVIFVCAIAFLRLFSAKVLHGERIAPGLLNQLEVLSLLDLEAAHQFFVLAHELFLDFSLLSDGLF